MKTRKSSLEAYSIETESWLKGWRTGPCDGARACEECSAQAYATEQQRNPPRSSEAMRLPMQGEAAGARAKSIFELITAINTRCWLVAWPFSAPRLVAPFIQLYFYLSKMGGHLICSLLRMVTVVFRTAERQHGDQHSKQNKLLVPNMLLGALRRNHISGLTTKHLGMMSWLIMSWN